MLGKRQEAIALDRLVELENKVREIRVIMYGSFLFSQKEKQELLSKGECIGYQQGQLDVWKVVSDVLEGNTNYHEYIEKVRTDAAKTAKEISKDVG